MPSPTRCAVVGSPVAHSLSPALHRAAYRHLGLGWTFDAVDVAEPALAGFLAGLDGTWRGLAVTMPLKRAALARCDTASSTARAVGAANTLLRADDGRLHGDNTDVPGLVAVLAAERLATATIVGGGATATSAVAALQRLGVAAPGVVVRSPERAAELVAAAERLGVSPQLRAWDELAPSLAADVVIVTTPAAAVAAEADRVRAGGPPPGLLLDLIYDPWPTPLAVAWAAAGGRVRGGLDLLVEQAALQVELMTGRTVPVPLLRAAGERVLAERAREPALAERGDERSPVDHAGEPVPAGPTDQAQVGRGDERAAAGRADAR
jgi:shikimate dehydrogenase